MNNQQYLTNFMEKHQLKGPDVAAILGIAYQTARMKMCGKRSVTDNDVKKMEAWRG